MDRLRLQVAAGSLTVRKLATHVGVSQPHMQNLVSGKRTLTVEMADRLLEFLQNSPLDLATGAELGGTLERVAPSAELTRYVPLLSGLLGPSHRFPELEGSSVWVPLPVQSTSHLRQPAFAELGLDPEVARDFPAASWTLLDTALAARLQVRIDAWYAIRWSGGGWLRRLRYEPGRLIVLGQEGLRPGLGPGSIELKGATVDTFIRGQVVWMGGDPRRFNPLSASGYLMPPVADS